MLFVCFIASILEFCWQQLAAICLHMTFIPSLASLNWIPCYHCRYCRVSGIFDSSVIYFYECYFHSSFRRLVIKNVCLYSAFSFHFLKINSLFSVCFTLLCQSWQLLNSGTAGSGLGATYDDLNNSTDKLNLIVCLCWCQWEWRLVGRGWFVWIKSHLPMVTVFILETQR